MENKIEVAMSPEGCDDFYCAACGCVGVLKTEVLRLRAENDTLRKERDEVGRIASEYAVKKEKEIAELRAELAEALGPFSKILDKKDAEFYAERRRADEQLLRADKAEAELARREEADSIRVKMALAVLDQDEEAGEGECESPKCGHEHICAPCMTIIRVRAELERPVAALASSPRREDGAKPCDECGDTRVIWVDAEGVKRKIEGGSYHLISCPSCAKPSGEGA